MVHWGRRYLSRMLMIDKTWEGEADIRGEFGMPIVDPCSDLVAHYQECPYVVIEEKSISDIPHAIRQLKYTTDHLIYQGYAVNECVIILESLRRFKGIFERDKDQYLKSKVNKRYVKIKNNIKIKVVYHSDLPNKR